MLSSSNRGAGESTQWAIGNFQTYQYSGMGEHGGVGLLDETLANGAGMIFGHRTDAEGCGTLPFSAQLEAWACPSLTDCANYKWGNQDAYNSCSSQLYDGTDYSFTVHAQGGGSYTASVTYWLDYWNGSSWVNMINGLNRATGTPVASTLTSLNPNGDGIAIFGTDTTSANNWAITVTNFNCGWF